MINANKNTIELYIHIPFCVKKCFYCDFLSFRALAADHEAYVDQLVREIRARGAFCSELTVSTVFIGGGTPTVMEPELIRRIMEAVKENFTLEPDAEITIEANPGTLLYNKLPVYHDCGINRVSIGLQSADNQELKNLGVTFVSKNEQFDTSTAMGEAMLKIILVFAELERNMTSERVTATMISRASNGQWNGGRIPYGYDYDPEEQAFSFNSDEYNIAHLIHDKYEELRSLVYLARYLNEHGYRTRAGNDWSPVSLDIILRSVFYCGDYQYNRLKEGDRQRPKDKSEWITVKDHHLAIVSREQKERILALLESNRRLKSFRKSGKSKYTHIFSGLLICGNCGQPMTSSISTVKKTTGRRYSLYFCPTHRKSKLWCTGKSTSDPIVGEFVFNYILNMLNAQKAFSPETSIQELEQQLLSGDTFSPVVAIAPDGLQDLFHTLRTGTVKGEVFGKDVKIKTDSEPPLQLSKLKKEKVRLERAIDRLNKLFLYSEKAMSESEYLTQKIQLSDALEEVEDKLAFLASEDSLQQSITDDEFIAKASNFILSQKLTDRNYVSFQSLSATVSPEVLDSFLSSIIDNIVFKDGAIHSITFRNGLSHTFIYKEKPEV